MGVWVMERVGIYVSDWAVDWNMWNIELMHERMRQLMNVALVKWVSKGMAEWICEIRVGEWVSYVPVN